MNLPRINNVLFFSDFGDDSIVYRNNNGLGNKNNNCIPHRYRGFQGYRWLMSRNQQEENECGRKSPHAFRATKSLPRSPKSHRISTAEISDFPNYGTN